MAGVSVILISLVLGLGFIVGTLVEHARFNRELRRRIIPRLLERYAGASWGKN